jgi:surface protein
MSFPAPITALKLRVSTGTSPNVQTFEQPILPSELSGTTTNSVRITNSDLLNAFNTNNIGTIYSSSIVTTYEGFPSNNTLTNNGTSNFIPRVLSLENISNKLTTDSPFSLSGLISTVSTGNLSYSSSNQSVSTVSTTGLVTIVGEGTTTITVNQATDATYGAASASKTFAVVRPPLISLAANGITILHTGLVSDVPSSTPLFKYENPRGLVTGPEWFAVVNQAAKPYITSYAKNQQTGTGKDYFTTSGQLVPFENIVTTHMTDMSSMFAEANTFNKPIGSWDTSSVTDMSYMFYNTSYAINYAFNQNIGLWNTSNVTNMSLMFRGANQFNNDNDPRIDTWDVSKVTNMNGIFARATCFNKSLNSWNTSNVTNMNFAFQNCTAFNGNIGSWNTSSVTQMALMFFSASAFNQPIGNWVTSSVTNMQQMFYLASVFNQTISNWDTSNVTDMSYMFANATAFNSPIASWDTSKVTNMNNMFKSASVFNQPIGSWDTSNVTYMTYMFYSASVFNQNISSWQVYKLTSKPNKPALFDVNSALLATNLPDWAMSAPAP